MVGRMDRDKVCSQMALEVPIKSLPEFFRKVRSWNSEYSTFRVVHTSQLEDTVMVQINEYGHHYPFTCNQIESAARDLMGAKNAEEARKKYIKRFGGLLKFLRSPK